MVAVRAATSIARSVATSLAGRGGATAPELPETISGLVAWFDPSSDEYFTYGTGSSIALWVPRAGTLAGSGGLAQSTSGSRPTLASSVSVLGNQRAVLFDGTDDYLEWSGAASDWTFLHDGSGSTIITVHRFDSTGGTSQSLLGTAPIGSGNIGLYETNTTASVNYRIANGSGVNYLSNWSISSATATILCARDTSIWRALTHTDGTRGVHASGYSATSADVTGQDPVATAPTAGLRIGAAAAGMNLVKGYVADVLAYSRVLTSDEIAALAGFFATKYGVAA